MGGGAWEGLFWVGEVFDGREGEVSKLLRSGCMVLSVEVSTKLQLMRVLRKMVVENGCSL